MRTLKILFLVFGLMLMSAISAQAKVNVVASIKPIHSLVSVVMKGVGKPGLIVEGAGSPHTYAMKPSQADMLEKADVIFWVGDELEAFLEKPIKTIGKRAKTVSLINAHGLKKLKFREGGDFEGHDHGHGDHKGHDDHKEHSSHKGHHDNHKNHKEHSDHKGHDDHKEHSGHNDHKGHDDHGYDPHVWLDPQNAKALVHEIGKTLAKADPANKAKYEANAKAYKQKLDALIKSTSTKIKPVARKKFIVFHDAYHYFEKRFGLEASGSITVSPEVMPGAERIKKLKAKVKNLGVACVFAEPQFEPKLVATIIEGTPAKSGTLDPLGANLEAGPDLYFKLIDNMANAFASCLGAK